MTDNTKSTFLPAFLCSKRFSLQKDLMKIIVGLGMFKRVILKDLGFDCRKNDLQADHDSILRTILEVDQWRTSTNRPKNKKTNEHVYIFT